MTDNPHPGLAEVMCVDCGVRRLVAKPPRGCPLVYESLSRCNAAGCKSNKVARTRTAWLRARGDAKDKKQ